MSGRIWLTATAILAAFLLVKVGLADPRLFLWLLPVAAVLVIGGLLLAGYTMRDRIAELEDENAALTERLGGVKAVPLVSFDSLSKAERTHIATAPRLRAADMKPDLHIVPLQRDGSHDDLPAADETWLDESPLFRDEQGRWS